MKVRSMKSSPVTDMSPLSIAITGVGRIGSSFAYAFVRAGHDVTVIARRLTTSELWPCASPAYLARYNHIISPDDLSGHVLFTHSQRLETWGFRTNTNDGEKYEIAIPRSTVIPEPEVLGTVLMSGAGVGLLPDFHAEAPIANGALQRILPHLNCGTVDAHALYPNHRSLSAKVRVFIDALVNYLSRKA